MQIDLKTMIDPFFTSSYKAPKIDAVAALALCKRLSGADGPERADWLRQLEDRLPTGEEAWVRGRLLWDSKRRNQ